MTYDQISPGMRAFLGTFITLRSLGYPASSIFLLVEGNLWNTRLDHLGNRFTIALGIWKTKKASVTTEYAKILKSIEAPHGISDADCERMMNECEARKNLTQLTLAMMQKGFRVPLPQEN